MKKKLFVLMSLISFLTNCYNFNTIDTSLVRLVHLAKEKEINEEGTFLDLEYPDITLYIDNYEEYEEFISIYSKYQYIKDSLATLIEYHEEFFNKNSLIFYTFTIDDNSVYDDLVIENLHYKNNVFNLYFSLTWTYKSYINDVYQRFIGLVEINSFKETIEEISLNYTLNF